MSLRPSKTLSLRSPEPPPWTQWWQDDLPCQFQAEQARANADYLGRVLGNRFLSKSAYPVGHVKHPILQMWRTQGAGAFLELNALAEDLRVIEGVPGLDLVLRDLRHVERCVPTWHAIHVAALLGRGEHAEVLHFYPQTDNSLPDFLVSTEGITLAVEAKLLQTSEKEVTFTDYASALSGELIAILKTAATPLHALLVLKDADRAPGPAYVLATVRAGALSFCGPLLEFRGPMFNVFLERAPSDGQASTDYGFTMLAPKSLREDLRAQARAKDASKQLAAIDSSRHPTIFCLGLSRLQDSDFVGQLLTARFETGQYSGISGVILLRKGPYLGPSDRGYIDRLAVMRNGRAERGIPNIRFSPVGLIEKLTSDVRHPRAVPAYRYGVYEATLKDGTTGLVAPDMLDLTPELLR